MICPNCKSNIPDDSKFCPDCGTSIANVANKYNKNVINVNVRRTESTKSKIGSAITWMFLWMFFIGIGLSIAFVVASLLFS